LEVQLKSFIDAIDVANDERTIGSALKSFASLCGFERFAYLQTAGGEIKTFNSYPPEWQDIYFRNRYSTIDPVVTTAKRRRELFAWSADDWLIRDQPKEQRAFQSQAVEFGIRSGVTIPVEGSFGSVLMLTFASSRARTDSPMFEDRARAERAVLCVHYRLRALAERSLSAPKLLLSPKELVCLKWAARGKYMPEIAELTNTQYRTIQHYLDNARAKLGATNLTHAVAIAKDRGLLEPD
jgi:LuxR family transcriptional activator of conjugal transfer of Ti plasmids